MDEFKSDHADGLAGLETFIPEEMKKFQIPTVCCSIVTDKGMIWSRGFGWQNKEKKIRATVESVFRVGSISKLFTAVAIMQLQERKKLSIDKPITDYCPELIFVNPFKKKTPLTLRHLLSHRSGILRESIVGSYFDTSEPSIQETVQSVIGSELIFEVGTHCKYSNLGPTVAGYILEEVTGMDFESYLQENIFHPLQMYSSSFCLKKENICQNLVEAFMVDFDGRFFPAPVFQLGTAPAGNLYSTVGDLSKFLQTILNGGKFGNFTLLKTETLKEMLTIQFKHCDPPPEFGLGFGLGKYGKHSCFWHNGIIYGYASELSGLVEEKIGVIILNNVDSAVGFNEKIKSKVLDLVLTLRGDHEHPAFVRTRCEQKLNPEEYTGKYTAENLDAWILVKGDHLVLKTMGVCKRIAFVALDKFITEDRLNYGMEVTFTRDTHGKIVSMKAGKFEYQKVAGYIPTRSIPSSLKKFVGDYGNPHNVLRIFVQDGRLTCLIEWFYEYPLTRKNELEFAFPSYGLYEGESIRFVQDEKGEIISAVAGHVNFPRIKGG
ncbi:MAG: hypothetical protein Kow0042_19280 [Calditrichia bacterium]